LQRDDLEWPRSTRKAFVFSDPSRSGWRVLTRRFALLSIALYACSIWARGQKCSEKSISAQVSRLFQAFAFSQYGFLARSIPTVTIVMISPSNETSDLMKSFASPTWHFVAALRNPQKLRLVWDGEVPFIR
jgi:hypothetical protein